MWIKFKYACFNLDNSMGITIDYDWKSLSNQNTTLTIHGVGGKILYAGNYKSKEKAMVVYEIIVDAIKSNKHFITIEGEEDE
jgi:hypothetical protein